MVMFGVPTIIKTIDLETEQACHEAAFRKYTKANGVLGSTPRYNSALNFHERIAEYAESLASEVVVAQMLEIDYDLSLNTFKQFADVGTNIEVRWSKYDAGHLIVYPRDRDGDIAILVTGKSPTYRIAGWLPVLIAKSRRYKHSSQDSWWIDQKNLQPMENLLRSSHGVNKS